MEKITTTWINFTTYRIKTNINYLKKKLGIYIKKNKKTNEFNSRPVPILRFLLYVYVKTLISLSTRKYV